MELFNQLEKPYFLISLFKIISGMYPSHIQRYAWI